MRVRRSTSEAASEAGLGAVRRVHRGHRGRPEGAELLPCMLAFVMVEGVVAAFDWRYTLVVPVVIFLGAACWVYLAPPEGSVGRRWFAVCEGGLLVWSREDAPIAVPWEALTPRWGPRKRLVALEWTDDAGEHTLHVSPVIAAGDLSRAVERAGPVRASLRPRLAIGAGAAAAVALVWWIVHPWLIPAVLGERPERLRDLARLCSQRDRPFERAAAYEGAGPHPLVFFRDGGGPPDFATAGRGDRRPAPERVELVACSRPAGRVSDKPIKVCLYQGNLRLESYQGRHRLDVYEARTGRRVARQILDGRSTTGECAPAKLVFGDPPYDEVRRGETYPSMSDYVAALQPLVTGEKRP
ncbi:MAG TPA: hypothetical protein VIL71_09670 [Spirillospora sp.]